MQSTMPFFQWDEGLIARSIMNRLSYNNDGEQVFAVDAVSSTGNVAMAVDFWNLPYMPILFDLIRNGSIPQNPYWNAGGLYAVNQDENRVVPVNIIIEELLKMPFTNKVISLFRDRTFKVWLVVERADIKTKRFCCNLFAELVDKYLPSDFLFDIRIITADNTELLNVPREATVTVRE